MPIIDEDTALRVSMSLLNLEPMAKRILRQKRRVSSGNITVREKIENERRTRDNYFKEALIDLKTEPFFRKWMLQSRKSMPQILDYIASSMGTMEGFELANRAMRENLDMQDAGVDLDVVEEFSKRSSRIGLFEFVLLKNNVSPRWASLAMAMFIAKEFGAEKAVTDSLVNKQLIESLKAIANKKSEGPYPKRESRSRAPSPPRRGRPPKPKPKSYAETDDFDE